MKFWRFVENKAESGQPRTLLFEGVIAEETWWGDEVTPKQFRDELNQGAGDILVRINSPGGDVFAANQIYTMLKEYPGAVTVMIDSLAASAATVVAMAGDRVLMSPPAMMMIHNPAAGAYGGVPEMQACIDLLEQAKEGIINAYQTKSGRRREEISTMMDAETWMSSGRAVDLGFADEVAYTERDEDRASAYTFNRVHAVTALAAKMREHPREGVQVNQLHKRMELIKRRF